ncbi:pectinesterase inhibitor 6-like [Argentina anserina]|uniref:pectinesterase inhibitor 6-like n=1 Tax=Argentina anserina TaxID=57926 RepID=UPI0021761F4C|nr:pectinesterase inhibitor 6-like [Potentilla anserina]
MAYANIFPAFFFAFLIIPTSLAAGNADRSYVEDACSVTRYRDLCIHSLASFSSIAKKSPSRWARAGVSVTLGETKNVAGYLVTLKKQKNGMKGKSGAALSDCIECFGNAIDELHKSLGVLRKLSRTTFVTQMGNLNTWLSAALTDGNTCLDGFEEDQRGKQIKSLQSRVLRATRFTSNALALANKLAATGLESFPDP